MIEWFDCDVLFVFIVGEGDIDVSLWLCLLCEFIGQFWVCEQLQLVIEGVKNCGGILDYILLFGLLGLGKMLLVMIIVVELGFLLWVMLGLVLECVGDLVVMLFNLVEYDVLFIDEIYCIVWFVEEMLYLVMEDFCVDVVVGKGFGVMLILLEVVLFILVGVIIWLGVLIGLLCDWFGFIVYMDFYEFVELEWVLVCFVGILGIELGVDVGVEIVCCFWGMLWIVNWLLCWVCDFVEVCVDGVIICGVVKVVLEVYDVDELGLDWLD